jgi:hypothetical protein
VLYLFLGTNSLARIDPKLSSIFFKYIILPLLKVLPNEERDDSSDIVWHSIVKNYDMILGAQLSNSLIILMALNQSESPLSASEISKVISSRSSGKIFKVPATLQDSIEKRLKREGYVVTSSIDGRTKCSITSKGKRLLQAWIAFLDGCS